MIVGLILIYLVGKAFYELARKHNKNMWGYGVLGVVSYYAGVFGSAIIAGIVLEFTVPGFVDDLNENLVGIMLIPFGAITCWLTYAYLRKSWSKPTTIIDNSTLDAGLMSSPRQETGTYNKDEK